MMISVNAMIASDRTPNPGVVPDDERCFRAVLSKDSRFDGWFFTAVRTTGIYCRPSCPAVTPKRQNVTFYPTAAAAQLAGYRACKRCRPDATPGSPAWNMRADVVGRAMRLIADGVIDREGVTGLASRLSYSDRQLNRLLNAEVGAGPLALARAQRAQAARVLIETTTMPFTDVAFGAGFASIRQFNDTIRDVFATSPTELRTQRKPSAGGAGVVSLRLAFRQPLDAAGLFGFVGTRAVPGVESWDGATYRRVLSLPHGPSTVSLTPAAAHVECSLRLADLRDLTTAVARCRRLLDLDADPESIADQLSTDELLAPLVRKSPGLRSPAHVDGNEVAVRAVLGQQVSVAGARTLAARLVLRYGQPLERSDGDLTHAFPTAHALASAEPADLTMPASRQRALLGMCRALADGRIILDAGADRARVETQLVALPGIGPWTAAYISMRALGDPDVFLPTDLGVRRALERLGAESSPKAAATRAEHWRPWRSYALHLLWSAL
jgi:AraC family transcriptional regulator, regulatory protein of adaptative response / DNA-3-methyladenine glycosylase II